MVEPRFVIVDTLSLRSDGTAGCSVAAGIAIDDAGAGDGAGEAAHVVGGHERLRVMPTSLLRPWSLRPLPGQGLGRHC